MDLSLLKYNENNKMSEYAPQYTFKERIKIIALHCLWAIPLFLVLDRLFFPWLNESNWILCHPYGWHMLWYGMGVFAPLFMLLVGILIQGRDTLKIYRLKQYPLPNKKVMNKTKYVYGFRATWRCYFFLIWCVGVLAFTVFGYFTAVKQTSLVDPKRLEQIQQKECNVSKI